MVRRVARPPSGEFSSLVCGWQCATSSGQEHVRQANRVPYRSRRPNGATQTFRRSSASTSMSSINQQDPSSAHAPPRYVPPHRNGTVADTRYSKDQLLDLFRAQQTSEGGLKDGLPNLYMGGWQPDISNGAASAGWGRTEHTRDGQPGPDICWDRDGSTEPLGLMDMDDEEREVRCASTRRNVSIRLHANVAIAFLHICEHSDETAIDREQGKSGLKWRPWAEGVTVWPALLSRRVRTPVSYRKPWARAPPRHERLLSVPTDQPTCLAYWWLQSRRPARPFATPVFDQAQD